MSTIKADTVTTKSDDTDLTITGGGTGVPNLEAGFKVGGSVGVPTASIQDDAVTTAKILAGTDGELITWDASGDPATVAVGTATHVLTSNGAGAAPTFQAAGGGDPNADYFHAYPSSNQSVSSATFSLIALQTEAADTANIFDNATNYRAVIPSGEVWYLYGATTYENSGTVYARCILMIRKNGTSYTAGTFNGDWVRYNSPNIATIVTGNGSDYYDLAIYQYNVDSPRSVTLSGDIDRTFFMGWRIR